MPTPTPKPQRPLKPYVIIGAAMVVAALVGSAVVTAAFELRDRRSGSEAAPNPAASSGPGAGAPSTRVTPPTGATPPVGVTPPAGATSPATATPGVRPPLAFTLRLVSVGDVRLVPSYADATRQIAYFAKGEPGQLDIEAKVTLFEPGGYDEKSHAGDDKATVAGRPGYFGVHEGPAVTAAGPHRLPTLSWPYRDKAWAVLTGARASGTKERLLQLADAVGIGPAYQVRLPCRFAYLPAALRPVSVEGIPLTNQQHLGWSAVRFADKTAGAASMGVLDGAALRVEWQAGPHAIDYTGDAGRTTVGGHAALWHRPNNTTMGVLEVNLPFGIATLRVDPLHAQAYPREELEKIVLGLQCAAGAPAQDLAAWPDLPTALGR